MLKELILKKRDGGQNTDAEIEALVAGYVRGELKDYQVAAWLMAVYFRGLSPAETSALTHAMWRSGESFPRRHREDYWIDKHSTGGVGDKTSLLLIPLVNAVSRRLFGAERVRIPMVSGRGLGHTGGTLDKLEAVPGFSPSIPLETAMRLLGTNGYFMIGQTPDLAPADRLFYALRDVTATVESLPLIISSIMSKKLSESLDGLVLDVKIGTGAFMRTDDEARRLARGLLEVARAHGIDAVAVLSRMDEPLGFTIGNHLEVEECLDFLKEGGRRERGLAEVTLTLAGRMISLASRGSLTPAQAEQECRDELAGPDPVQIYRRMFAAQGGRWEDFEGDCETVRTKLPRYEWRAPHKGIVERMEARGLGVLLGALGGGRNAKEDAIDPLVGIELNKKVGEEVEAGETVVIVYYRKAEQLAATQNALDKAIRIGKVPAPIPSWIVGILE